MVQPLQPLQPFNAREMLVTTESATWMWACGQLMIFRPIFSSRKGMNCVITKVRN